MIKTQTTSKTCLSGLSEAEMTELTKSLKWPSFKAKQIHSWIYKKWIAGFDEMSDLSKNERSFLKENYDFSYLTLLEKQESQDKTIKFLWKTKDEMLVESVRMYMDGPGSFSACISSQVGCAVGCPFCATGKLGLKRNLKAEEIVDQILGIQRITKERISNIVFMGQGEPLQNYNEVLKAIHLIKDSVSIGARHITLSTSGIPPLIKKLADEKLQITLALSLHAPDQRTREILVPLARRYNMTELMDSLTHYYKMTKRRITFEYVMLEGINDQIEKAKSLADLVKGIHCHINLIPYNPILSDSVFQRPSSGVIQKFKDTLEKKSNKKVTIRHERGKDINAACGQLANIHTNHTS